MHRELVAAIGISQRSAPINDRGNDAVRYYLGSISVLQPLVQVINRCQASPEFRNLLFSFLSPSHPRYSMYTIFRKGTR